jgi:ubiquinone/menaquinone biosynthesis C-methylase UbiE
MATIMATILMALAESKAPNKYELLINLLTLGNREKIYKHIKDNYLEENQLILDAGCGTGKFLQIADLKWTKSVGLDISDTMLEQALKKSFRRKTSFRLIRASITALPIKAESFDIITSFLVLSELAYKNVRKALQELLFSLKNDGLLILATESKSKSKIKQIVFNVIRAPAYIITSFLVKVPKHPIHDITTLLVSSQGSIIEQKTYLGGQLTLYIFKKQKKIRT